MKYRAIVFDKDGTLVDFDKLWVPAARKTANTVYGMLCADTSNVDAYLKDIGVVGHHVDVRGALPRGAHKELTELMRVRLSEVGVDISYDELFPLAISVYSASAKEVGGIYPICEGLYQTLQALHSRGLKLAVITSDGMDGAVMCLNKLGITECFDEILAFDGVHPAKPDPYYMNYFCNKFSLSPSEVLMVGDTETDMRFGNNSGAYSIAVGKRADERDYLIAKGADDAIYDVSCLADWLDKHS